MPCPGAAAVEQAIGNLLLVAAAPGRRDLARFHAAVLAPHFVALVADDQRRPAKVGRPTGDDEWRHPDDRRRLLAFRSALVVGHGRLERPRLTMRTDATLRALAPAHGVPATLRVDAADRAAWVAVVSAALGLRGRPAEAFRRHVAGLVAEAWEAVTGRRATYWAGNGVDDFNTPAGEFAAFAWHLDVALEAALGERARLRGEGSWGAYTGLRRHGAALGGNPAC